MKKEIYIKIAEETSAFNPAEIEILDEVLADYFDNPKTTYILFDERNNDRILGFALFGRSPMTKFSWDIYWMVVGKEFQRKGIGKKLQERIEKHVLKKGEKAILMVETSSKPEYEATRNFYRKTGFIEMGRVPDFYKEDDSLVIFYKKLDISK
ncbi:MAG: GNAT family N-acetyltransferase [bacterium]